MQEDEAFWLFSQRGYAAEYAVQQPAEPPPAQCKDDDKSHTSVSHLAVLHSATRTSVSWNLHKIAQQINGKQSVC